MIEEEVCEAVVIETLGNTDVRLKYTALVSMATTISHLHLYGYLPSGIVNVMLGEVDGVSDRPYNS